MSFVIYRHEHGISLNPREYVLDKPDGEWITFETHQEATKFITDAGYDADIIDNGIYIESIKDTDKWGQNK